MREIKFRAWHLKEKFMHSVGELSFRAGGIKWYGPGVGWGWATADMPEVEVDSVLMQFTGLLDKNGVEIYEGDIYRTPYGTGVIKYHKCAFVVTDPAGNMTSINGLYNTVDCVPDAIRAVTCEVIGNIYESPELLKEHPHD